jgi:hypothetical protein
MPKGTPLENLIPTIYKRNTLHTAIFFWVNGQRSAFPNSISIEASLNNFYKFTGTSEELLPIKTAKQVYNRMQKELLEAYNG